MGATPLHFSAVNGSEAVAEALLRAGGDPNVAGGRRGDPGAASGSSSRAAAGAGVASAALEGACPTPSPLAPPHAAARPPLAPSPAGSAPLYVASRRGHAGVVRALLRGGARPEEEGANGTTPLVAACGAGHEDTVRALLDGGAGAETRDSQGNTPLLVAAWRGCAGAVEALVAAGASPAARAGGGYTPLFVAAQARAASPRQPPALSPNPLLPPHGSSSLAASPARAALSLGAHPRCHPAQEGRLDAVRILLASGAPPDAPDDTGATPLIACAQARIGRGADAAAAAIHRSASDGAWPTRARLKAAPAAGRPRRRGATRPCARLCSRRGPRPTCRRLTVRSRCCSAPTRTNNLSLSTHTSPQTFPVAQGSRRSTSQCSTGSRRSRGRCWPPGRTRTS